MSGATKRGKKATHMAFGARLKHLRGLIGDDWTQERVAAEVFCSVSSYQSYEAGDRFPAPEMLTTLAEFYRTTTDYLLGRTEEPGVPVVPPKTGQARQIVLQVSSGAPPTPASPVGGGGAMSQVGPSSSPVPSDPADSADPLVMLSRTLRLLEAKEANAVAIAQEREKTERQRIDAQAETERQRITEVDGPNAKSLQRVLDMIESRKDDRASNQ